VTISVVEAKQRLKSPLPVEVEKVLPHLTLAQVYDALSYYYDHQADLDRERAENTEAAAQARLRERVGDANYQRIVGRAA